MQKYAKYEMSDQDKQLIEKHGIRIVVGKQYYRVGIAPDIIQNFKKVVKK